MTLPLYVKLKCRLAGALAVRGVHQFAHGPGRTSPAPTRHLRHSSAHLLSAFLISVFARRRGALRTVKCEDTALPASACSGERATVRADCCGGASKASADSAEPPQLRSTAPRQAAAQETTLEAPAKLTPRRKPMRGRQAVGGARHA